MCSRCVRSDSTESEITNHPAHFCVVLGTGNGVFVRKIAHLISPLSKKVRRREGVTCLGSINNFGGTGSQADREINSQSAIP